MNLREQLVYARDLSKYFTYLDVKYFDLTDNLPKNITTLLNSKLDIMKQRFKEGLFEM